MKTRHFWGALALLFCAFSFIGCSNDDEEEGKKVTDYKELVLTVASKTIPGIIMEGNSVVSELYAVKKEQADEWIAYGGIAGFEYEKGYEYKSELLTPKGMSFGDTNTSFLFLLLPIIAF